MVVFMSCLVNANGYIVCRSCGAYHTAVPMDENRIARCLNCGKDVNEKPLRRRWWWR